MFSTKKNKKRVKVLTMDKQKAIKGGNSDSIIIADITEF